MVGVGLACARGMKSLDHYFAGSKQLSWWMGGVSFVMSYVSALSIVVYAGLGYQYGLVALTLYWTTVPATILITALLAERWRRAGIITPVEFLEARFSPTVRQVFAWSGVPLKLIDEGLKIVAIGIFVSVGMGISSVHAMLAVGLITLVYTMLGGLWAVVIADFAQFVLVGTAVVLLLPLTLTGVGGWRHFRFLVPSGFLDPVNGPFHWSYVGAFLVLSILSLSGNWSLIQKFYSARSDTDSRRVGWLASAIFLLLPPAWILTGMLARGLISPLGTDPQTIYARISLMLLPPGMFGLMVAALFSATMSVLSSGYNVTAAVLTVDVYQRWIHPGASQRELIVTGRVLTTFSALVALAIGLAVTYFHWTIFNAMVTAFGFFLPPTVLPVLGGLLSERLSAVGALAGFFAGIVVGLIFFVYPWIVAPAHPASYQAISIAVPALITAVTLVLATRWFPSRGTEQQRAGNFWARLHRAAPQSTHGTTHPVRIAGVVILVMGLVLVVLGWVVRHQPRAWLTPLTGTFLAAVGAGMTARPRSHRKFSSTLPAA
jgi:SSS family solute:Na+ symporter